MLSVLKNKIRRKRVAFVSLADLSVLNGQGIYARRVYPRIIEALCSQAIVDTTVIAPCPQGYSEFISEFPNKVEYKWIPKKRKRNPLWHLLSQIYIFAYLLRIRPSTVVFSIKPSMFAIELARFFLKFEKVILVEGLGKKNLKTLGGRGTVLLGKMGFRLSFNNAKAVFPAYKSAYKWVQEYNLGAHVEIIPCGVDTNIFRPVFNKFKENESENITVGYVGSFRDVHKLDLLIKIVIANKRISLKLIGNGEMLSSTKSLVAEHDLETRVVFRGEVSQHDIPREISTCDIMWAYTDIKHWGVPIKAFEYLACNKYVLASSREEFDFIDELGFGCTTRSEDVAELSLLLNDIADKIKKSASVPTSHEYICTHYNWKNFSKVASYI